MCQLVLQLVFQLVLQLGRIDMAQTRAVVWCWSAADLIASMQHPYSTNVVLSNMADHFGPDSACC